MKIYSFTAGVLTAGLVLLTFGAASAPQRPQWEYAELTRELDAIQWIMPEKADSVTVTAAKPTDENRATMTEDFKRLMGIEDPDSELTTLEILNHVGNSGWELMYEKRNQQEGQNQYLFKRRR